MNWHKLRFLRNMDKLWSCDFNERLLSKLWVLYVQQFIIYVQKSIYDVTEV
jgi:hypothetical protein